MLHIFTTGILMGMVIVPHPISIVGTKKSIQGGWNADCPLADRKLLKNSQILCKKSL